MMHPMMSCYHNPDDEPKFREPLILPLPDDTLFTVNDYRDRIYGDVLQIPRAMWRVAEKERHEREDEEDEDDEEEGDD